MRRRAGHLDRRPDGDDRMDRAAAQRDARVGDARDQIEFFHHAASPPTRSEEHTSELQSLMRISYAVFCLKKKKKYNNTQPTQDIKVTQIKTYSEDLNTRCNDK